MSVIPGELDGMKDKLPEDIKYIDILVEITLNFIRAVY